MPFTQKLSIISFSLLSFLFYTNFAIAQQQNNKPLLVEHKNGRDLFPVYKATQKNSFIDSIIYNGPFITFCVSFEKPTSDGHYLLEAVNSKDGWICRTPLGVYHPVLIKNIRKDGQLISDYLKVTPIDLIFRNKENPTTHISCEFQFLRRKFVAGVARISESSMEEYGAKKSTTLKFKDIRIRTGNYPKPLHTQYTEDFKWVRKDLLQKINFTVNEVPQEISTKVVAENSMPDDYLLPNYKVLESCQNQLFLKGIWHTATATIFRVQYYVTPYAYGGAINLYNKQVKITKMRFV